MSEPSIPVRTSQEILLGFGVMMFSIQHWAERDLRINRSG